MASVPTIAYLTRGKLYLKPPSGEARELVSTFAEEVTTRAQRQQALNGWKSEGGDDGPFAGRMLWGRGAVDAAVAPITVTGLARGAAEDELVYLLNTGTVGALLSYNLSGDRERRLFHKADFQAGDLHLSQDRKRLACSISREQGIANLAIMDADGRNLVEITEGDTIDRAPAWSAADPEMLLYQSAGIGRNAHGLPVAMGPACIERLHLKRGTIDTLCSDPQLDFLSPRMDSAGNLYFLQRPYEAIGRFNRWKVLTDILLFPYRVLRSIVHFLDFFSRMFSGKPLLTAGRPSHVPGDDLARIMLWGKVVDTRDAYKDGDKAAGSPVLVPRTWQLTRETPDGTRTALAHHVIGYDLAPDGSLVYTTGGAVYQLVPGEQPVQLFTGQLIDTLVLGR